MLLRQLKKDRRKVINDFIDTIEKLQQNGEWIKGYIGNKIIENNNESTTDDGELKSPIKEFEITQPGELKELISTERFLFDDDIKNNPYLFESDDFVRQKYLEKKYQAYGQVSINNDEFVKQSIPKDEYY